MFYSSESVQNCESIINSVNQYALSLPLQVKDANGMIYNNLYFFNPVINTILPWGLR